VEDLVRKESVSDLHLSPDGEWVVLVRYQPDEDKDEQVGQLVRIHLRTGKERQLTRGSDSCTSPRWSSEGMLAFLSSRPAPEGKSDDSGKRRRAGAPRVGERSRSTNRSRAGSEEESSNQVWVMDPQGGEPWPVTELTRGVDHFAWAGPDAIIVAAKEEPTRREQRLTDDDKDTTRVVEDDEHEPPVRLFRVVVASRKVTRVSNNRDRIQSLSVSPDGRWAVASHNRTLRYLFDNRTKPVYYLHDLKGGKEERILADPRLNISKVFWAPDSQSFYACNDHSTLPQLNQAGVTELYHFRIDKRQGRRIDLDWPRGVAQENESTGGPCVVPLEDGFLTLLADGVRYRAARYRSVGEGKWRREWLEGEHARQLFGLESSPDGKAFLYATSTASQPVQWYAARLEETRIRRPVPLVRVNQVFEQRQRARTEVVTWKGAYGEEVEGILYYPLGYRTGTKAPLVVMIHGGPASADLDSWEEGWHTEAQLLCQRGAFVLKPNYHGSTNYGLAWVESIARGKYLDPELDDIEKGVDALINRGLVDPDRLGLQGWSNGAILTNALTTRTTRYKAAVTGAGSVEYVSDWASCEFGEAFDRFYFGQSPLENVPLYQRKSPFYRLDKVRTPTLIFFGSEDRTVHPQQGWAHYRGLQQLGKSPVRFVLFPGAKHRLDKLSHQKRKLTEELAWFDRYLFATNPAAEDLVKEDSPLAWALARQKAKRVGTRYGLLEAGRLIPETVRYNRLLVGRFEVTRAQYAEFDKTHPVMPGQENHPATGVTFEQAEAYCRWLSKQTGRVYRLPTEDEARDLYDEDRANENTLDRWAGYTVNPDDGRKLQKRIQELGPGALLSEVGRFRGVGKGELVFDLGGNVAEWVRSADGKGVLRGGSADLPADRKGSALEAGAEYRGFRVVREE
jgi:dipeptidyl aminopeptidase/acylaminoacyl peptidase